LEGRGYYYFQGLTFQGSFCNWRFSIWRLLLGKTRRKWGGKKGINGILRLIFQVYLGKGSLA